jgi:hypothetical protein
LSVRASLGSTLRLIFAYNTKLHDAATVEAKLAETASTISALLRDP